MLLPQLEGGLRLKQSAIQIRIKIPDDGKSSLGDHRLTLRSSPQTIRRGAVRLWPLVLCDAQLACGDRSQQYFAWTDSFFTRKFYLDDSLPISRGNHPGYQSQRRAFTASWSRAVGIKDLGRETKALQVSAIIRAVGRSAGQTASSGKGGNTS